MAETEYQIRKATAVPVVPVPANTMYVVAPSNTPEHIEIYMSDNTGNVLKRMITESDVASMINQSVANIDKFTSVATIAERDALDTATIKRVFVTDASTDSTVNGGSASYAWDDTNSTWIKTSESESLDIVVNWASLEGKPSSTVAQIDNAVQKTHTHTNKTELDKIGQDSNGRLTYNGSLVATTINDAW